MTNHNLALIIVRSLALICVALGFMWIVHLIAATFLTTIHTPEWLMSGIWNYAVAGILSGPIWLIAGAVGFAYSDRLARFVAKGTKDDAA